MNPKQRQAAFVGLGVLMFVFAGLTGASAHLTNADGVASYGVGGQANPDPCRQMSSSDGLTDDCDPAAAINFFASGNYYTTPQTWTFKTAMGPFGVTGDVCAPVPLGFNIENIDDGSGECNDDTSRLKIRNQTFFPAGSFAVGLGALCDAEVANLLGEDDELNEDVVDNRPGPGAIPDGTIDDGGFGAVCHTAGHYAVLEWDTLGCGNTAHAEDWVSDGLVWISYTCAHFVWVNDTAGDGGGDVINRKFGLNSVLGGTVQEDIEHDINVWLPDYTDRQTDYVNSRPEWAVNFVNGLLEPPQAPEEDTSDDINTCGNPYGDGREDDAVAATAFGFGGGHGGDGVTKATFDNGCAVDGTISVDETTGEITFDQDTADSTETIVVWNAANVDNGDVEGYAPGSVSPATSGWAEVR